jgi:outer membrane protein TolC
MSLAIVSFARSGSTEDAAVAGETAPPAQAPIALTPTDAYIESLIGALAKDTQEARSISLREAIHSAIANNPGIRAQSRLPDATSTEILNALSVYDPSVRVGSGYNRGNELTSDALLTSDPSDIGGDPSSVRSAQTLREDEYYGNIGISKRSRLGTQLDLTWENFRRTSSTTRQLLSPRFDPTLRFEVAQPLLNDFAGLGARTDVLIAENASRRSAADFEARLSDFVAGVIEAYWSYTLAEAQLDVAKTSLSLARELVTEAQARVEIGTLPPVAVKEAQADAAAREGDVIFAENRLDLAARTLQYSVMFVSGPTGAPAPIRPSERHTVAEEAVDRATLLRTAVEQRPEVRAARIEVASATLESRRTRNALLPNLDLVGNYELVGLGGRVAPRSDDPDTPENEARGPDSRDELSAYDQALDNMLGGDYYRYLIGLELEIPLWNAQARSQNDLADITLYRRRDELRQAVSDIALEVEDSVGDVVSAFKRVAAARIARELAEENLRNQRKRYDVGMVTTTDILTFQDNLAAAMAAEAEAVADHAISVAALKRAQGTLLESYDVSVRYKDVPDQPWWSRF